MQLGSTIRNMEELLTPVSQTYRKPIHHDELLEISKPVKSVISVEVEFHGSSPEEVLDALKSQPGYDSLISILKYLQKGTQSNHDFDIRKPTPQSAQIIHTLVTEIVPNYWTILRDASIDRSKGDVHLLISSLKSITGINALLAFLRALLKEAKSDLKSLKDSHVCFTLSFILELLSQILQSDDDIKRIWDINNSLHNQTQIRPLRQELISLFTNGKIVSLSAEAEDICRQAGQLKNDIWLSNTKLYVDWVAQNVVLWVRSGDNDDDLKLCAEISTRAMRLANAEIFVNKLITGLLLQDIDSLPLPLFEKFLGFFPPLDHRKILGLILKLLPDKYLNTVDGSDPTKDAKLISAASGVLKTVVGNDEARKTNLISWLTSGSGAGIGEGYGVRRAAVAVFSDDKESMVVILERSLAQFGDKLYIKHAPLLQQDAHAQVLLLSVGYVHRLVPIKLTMLSRSSPYLNAVSNRIAASQNRARFLGMVVGEALSGLVHGKETKLDFKMDEMDTEEARWYKSLVRISDKVGSLDPLRQLTMSRKPTSKPKPARSSATPTQLPRKQPTQSGFIIEEIEDEEEGEDPDLVPYAKIDSDAEDSDDDPTLINRDKPKAPVYVRDLIAYFRDTENYDKQKLALMTAPTLIRRKANYGTEVSSHADELATLLVGLQDKYDLDNFDELRQQGMIAVVVAQPKIMGQWFAKTFFDGDYSLSQRASILIVLGLSGREIAGFETSEYTSAAQFPSKVLPSKVEKHYITHSSSNRLESSTTGLKPLPSNALDNLAQTLSQTFLAPLAAEAADSATGPDTLKLSSFTSRLNSQSPNQARGKAKPRMRAIPNTTASLIASSFFFPLTSRFQAAMHSASATTRGILFQPYLLTLYLKTLALLLHAAGPSTLALPQMTAEFWDLLLGVRGQCAGDLGVTQAVLFGLMALLDVNEADMRGLCERHGREAIESVEWVGAVFSNTRGGDVGVTGEGGEENEVKMLAAGVLIRLREAVDKYQAVLMGDLIGFT
ncbi:telomere length regulation protein-domain-containing protein [Annulohypoxylon maeteangense]|uniref:telomere length regulation protein-domain-containing protein n=1 Tax=Annulohypoxylon maeteangense TaxID=1927788 RepID=UPI00200721E5|nr:telomere length regulation protein-domain-containing protein [Annulohypoxylon maeteangense]KAI0890169.1 telomere length regulation protein-domain-containing protein [Annulohypoxylon maeteangense]